MMTQRQIQLVRSSWRDFQRMDPALIGATFYEKLFLDQPGLRRLFPSAMTMQYRKLMDMLSTIVARLDRQDELLGQLQDMGQRHAAYGVRDIHYDMVGKALLWTIETASGKDWNAELSEAWLACYTEVATRMYAPA